ncbi:MAG: ferritin family protein [bacterium]|nr:ferritin family protein [bacterium]
MSETKEKIAEVLKCAMRGEEDGYKFYNLLAERATNQEAKKKLEGLRDDEIRHKQVLKEIYAEHVGGEIGELPEKGLSVLTEIFAKGKISQIKTEMEFINLAIEAELAASKYYQEQYDLIDDPTFKKIFDQLADEEHHHFELLQAEKDALSGNYSWFEFGDTSPMEH